MSIEEAKRFLEQVKADEQLQKRVSELNPDEVEGFAKELGFDVTGEDLEKALRQLRQTEEQPKELNPDELDNVAGGAWFLGEDAPDGHEMGCDITYHHYAYQRDNKIWCKKDYYCDSNNRKYSGFHCQQWEF